MSCEKIVAILGLDGGTHEADSLTTYGDNVGVESRGAVFKTTYFNYSSSPSLETYCRAPMPNIGEIMGVRLKSRSGFGGSESGSYPNRPEWNYDNQSGDSYVNESEFFILNTRSGPDYWLPGVEPPSEVTPLATTKPGIQDRDFLVWIGDRSAINQWISLNSLKIDVSQSFINFSGGTSSSTLYQYQGWKMLCSFPYDALLKYPFCGGVVVGREEEGPQFINLCENDLGVCDEDCCDCCSVADRVLAKLKNHPLYR